MGILLALRCGKSQLHIEVNTLTGAAISRNSPTCGTWRVTNGSKKWEQLSFDRKPYKPIKNPKPKASRETQQANEQRGQQVTRRIAVPSFFVRGPVVSFDCNLVRGAKLDRRRHDYYFSFVREVRRPAILISCILDRIS